MQLSWASDSNRQRVAKGLSTTPVTVTTGDLSFRIAKNHLSPFESPDVIDHGGWAFSVYVFLPDYSGYTHENWSDYFNPNRMLVGILPTARHGFMTYYARLTGSAGPPLREQAGLMVYAKPNTPECYPEEILAGEHPTGQPVYINCIALDQPVPTCNQFFYGEDQRYILAVSIRADKLPQWRAIVDRVRPLVASWQHAAR